MRRLRVFPAVAVALLPAVLAGCGSSSSTDGTTSFDPANWRSVLAAAKGQTVNWYMYGADDKLNSFVTGYATDELKKDGVTLNQSRSTTRSRRSTRSSVRSRPGRTPAARSTSSG